jgi:hypothetical protein
MGIGRGWLVVVATASLAACNMITGVDDVHFTDDDDTGSGGSSNAAGPTSTSGVGGGSTSSAPTEPMSAADGVAITAVSLFQGTRRPLMENGAAAQSQVPIVMGREALFRVHYAVDPPAVGTTITAKLTLGDADPIYLDATLGQGSSEADLTSTVNIHVSGELMVGSSYRVELLQPSDISSGTNPNAAYPADGQDALPVQSAGNQLRVQLVPIRYGADGSNRLPDTSAAQVERYRELFYKLYPAPAVEITVGAPVQWDNTISGNGSGWQSLLNAMIDYRQSSKPPPDQYLYAIFSARDTFASFCNGGCVAGLSPLAGPGDEWARVGIGLGFSGEGSVETAVHEVGHAHGRGHAPCDTGQGLDPNFPYSNGSLGDWGYDLVEQTLVSASTKDFMSYCDPTFVSDYNFRQLFQRMRLVNNADQAQPPVLAPQLFDRVIIDENGAASWGAAVTLNRTPSGEPTTVTTQGSGGEVEITGYFYPYSHLDGGLMLLPKTGTQLATEVAFSLGEQRHLLSR